MLWARVPARTLARKDAPCPPQARTGDPPRPSGRQQDPGPVAGFARRSRKSAARQRNRVGHRLPLPDTLTFAHQIRGHSLPPVSKRSRSIRQRERTESAMGMGGVEKMGWIFWGKGGNAGWWAGVLHGNEVRVGTKGHDHRCFGPCKRLSSIRAIAHPIGALWDDPIAAKSLRGRILAPTPTTARGVLDKVGSVTG
jgi:hypothetical protein